MWDLSTAGFNAENFPRAWADGDQFIKEQSRHVSGIKMSNHSHAVKRNLTLLCIFIYFFMFYFFFHLQSCNLAATDVANWIDPIILVIIIYEFGFQ